MPLRIFNKRPSAERSDSSAESRLRQELAESDTPFLKRLAENSKIAGLRILAAIAAKRTLAQQARFFSVARKRLAAAEALAKLAGREGFDEREMARLKIRLEKQLPVIEAHRDLLRSRADKLRGFARSSTAGMQWRMSGFRDEVEQLQHEVEKLGASLGEGEASSEVKRISELLSDMQGMTSASEAAKRPDVVKMSAFAGEADSMLARYENVLQTLTRFQSGFRGSSKR